MKFSVSKDRILDELQNLQGIVEKRNTMPILANILLNVTDTEVEITGTDLEVGMRTHFAAEIEETGTVTVSGKNCSKSSNRFRMNKMFISSKMTT